MEVFRGVVSLEEQKSLYEGVKRIASSRKGKAFETYRKLFSLIVGNCSWKTSVETFETWPDVPGGVDMLCQKIWQATKRNDPYRCAMVECHGYPQDGSLEGHVDHVAGFAIVISLGATANFYFGDEGPDGPLHRVKLSSGDAVIFPANSTANIYHGIDSFDQDLPSWWTDEDYARVCVQYRQQL